MEGKSWADKKGVKKDGGRKGGQKSEWNERMDEGNVRGVEAFVPWSKAGVSIKGELGGRRVSPTKR